MRSKVRCPGPRPKSSWDQGLRASLSIWIAVCPEVVVELRCGGLTQFQPVHTQFLRSRAPPPHSALLPLSPLCPLTPLLSHPCAHRMGRELGGAGLCRPPSLGLETPSRPSLLGSWMSTSRMALGSLARVRALLEGGLGVS